MLVNWSISDENWQFFFHAVESGLIWVIIISHPIPRILRWYFLRQSSSLLPIIQSLESRSKQVKQVIEPSHNACYTTSKIFYVQHVLLHLHIIKQHWWDEHLECNSISCVYYVNNKNFTETDLQNSSCTRVLL